jgi:exodeoxyribonuclease-3
MKIATFNINNINRRLPNLLQWLESSRPDIACLQELKSADAEFPKAAISKAGYRAVWRGERTWNGVAILSRVGEPIVTRNALPGDPNDKQSRYLEAAVGGILVGCIYLPNGNPQPGPKFDYKLAWFKRLTAHAKKLLAQDIPVILAGDYNVAPTELDIYKTKSWDDDALIAPESRASYAKLVKQGWTDAIRALHPEAPMFTFWHYMRNRWPRDAGLRLDHLLLSPQLTPRLTDAGIDREVRGRPNASDHAPVWIELGTAGKSRKTERRKTAKRETAKQKTAKRKAAIKV